MERNEISSHEVRFFEVARKRGQWATAADLAKQAHVADRTARAFAKKFVELGIFDVVEVYPGHRYRFAPKAKQRNTGYLKRLEQAVEVFSGDER
jgi:hypothetical protein